MTDGERDGTTDESETTVGGRDGLRGRDGDATRAGHTTDSQPESGEQSLIAVWWILFLITALSAFLISVGVQSKFIQLSTKSQSLVFLKQKMWT